MDVIKSQLDKFVNKYNEKWFILDDPISIPHKFKKKEDIEIAGFLTSIIAWGQRKAILSKANLLMEIMDNSPYEYITQSDTSNFEDLSNFVYRTFNGFDAQYFVSTLREIYLTHGGLEKVFTDGYKTDNTIFSSLSYFRSVFMSYEPFQRTEKHLANVLKGSAAKRINMFLRWMVRDDNIVDFGLWKEIPKNALMIPLDVHVGRVARSMGLLERKQNDWKAVEELTSNLRKFDADDPIRYDYALFGLGVYNEKIDF